jgi:hypothetical protein
MKEDNPKCPIRPSSLTPHPSKVARTQRQIAEHRTAETCVEVVHAAGRPAAGVPVWAEQESHTFAFGCVAPDLSGVREADHRRCADRLAEVFNRIADSRQAPDPGVLRVEVPDGVHLGRFARELDRLAGDGRPLEVYVSGRALGAGPDGPDAERVAALYTLCFAQPAVCGIVWSGFWDGEPAAAGGGLLRTDFSPRPAFRYLHKLIGTVWHSRASGDTDAAGQFRFRGFLGDYRVGARVGEAPATTGRLELCRGTGLARLQLPGGDLPAGSRPLRQTSSPT